LLGTLPRAEPLVRKNTSRMQALLRGGFFAQAAHAFLEFLAQRRWGIGVESY
jgi:hypothetical protein